MFAQLLGMGRAKREKDRDSAKDGLQTEEATSVVANGSPHLVGENGGETTGTHSPYPKSPSIAAAQRNGNPFRSQPSHRYPGSHGDTAVSATGGSCGNASDASCAEEPIPTDSGAARLMRSPGSSSTAAVASPSPAPAASGPSGSGENAGFSAPGGSSATSFCSSSVMMPRAPKVFAMEVGVVEQGLHIQLGQPGAKTEAQLGDRQLESAKRLRHMLATNRARTIQELLNRGWVPLLLRWLGLVHRPNLQVETLAALTTVAQNTSDLTPLLLKHGAVGTLVSLLKSPSLEMVEQAMWVLGKMAQDSQDGTTARDTVLQAGALGPIVRRLEQHPTLLNLQRIGAWAIFNVLDGQPRPTIEVATVSTVMPGINRLLRSVDTEVLSHACSALSHLCDGSAAHIKIVVDSGVCGRLVQLLDHPSSQVVKPALRTIGNVVCAEDDADYTEAILEAGSVVCLKRLIAHPNREIQKEACWTLSNIAAGSVSQIQSVLDSGAMPQLIKLATSPDTEAEVRSEAFWVVLNAASCGSDAQIEYLVSQGCVQILSDLLGESSMVMMALEGIERVLSVGDLRVVRNAMASHSNSDKGAEDGSDDQHDGVHCADCASEMGDGTSHINPYACMLIPEKIQALETHKNSAVAKRANRMWARYFVTCAICRLSFSRHGSGATFCPECKCHVCGSCDCTVFHLAYQDKLWEEMEGKERQGKQAQQAAKKNKKAKKKEKRKNAAAKEAAVVEPPKTRSGIKNNQTSGQVGVAASGGDKPETSGSEARLRESKRRSRSPHKNVNTATGSSSSSAASTESNSDEEYNPSSPPTPQDAYASTPAGALITATAMAVTAAAAAAAAPKPSSKANGSSRRPAAAENGDGGFPKTSKADERRRKKGGSEGVQQQQRAVSAGTGVSGATKPVVSGSSARANVSATRRRKGENAINSSTNIVEDDSEGQWVVVGSKGGAPQGTGSASSAKGTAWGSGASGQKQSKWGKGQQSSQQQQQQPQHRAGDATGQGQHGIGLPNGGGVSVVGWASESSPASVARKVSASAAAARSKSVAPPPSLPTNSSGGKPWGGIGSAKGVVAQASASLNPVVIGSTPGLPSNGFRTVPAAAAAPVANSASSGRASSSHRRRPGPGTGSVWGASPVVSTDARSSKVTLGDVMNAKMANGHLQGSRPLGPSNRGAGVIGPPPQNQKTISGSGSTSGTSTANRSTCAVTREGRSKSEGGEAGLGVPAGGGRRGVPGASGDGGEALVENEKLVSFLMETGSILALAQRLEDEEEWRKSATSASSGRS